MKGKLDCLVILGLMLGVALPPCLATPVDLGTVNVGPGVFAVLFTNSPASDTLDLPASTPVTFTFDITPPSGLGSSEPALFTLSAVSTTPASQLVSPSLVPPGVYLQGGYNGSFSIQLQTPVDGMTNLLSGTISGATLLTGPGSATLTVVNPNFTSDFLKSLTDESVTVSLSATNATTTPSGVNTATPSTPKWFINTFQASSGLANFNATIPEPMTFLLLGSGLLAFGLLRRNLK